MSVASGYYEEYESLRKEGDFYGYEKKFVELWQRLGREYMENPRIEPSYRKERNSPGNAGVRRR
jgi:hypothetical protein